MLTAVVVMAVVIRSNLINCMLGGSICGVGSGCVYFGFHVVLLLPTTTTTTLRYGNPTTILFLTLLNRCLSPLEIL